MVYAELGMAVLASPTPAVSPEDILQQMDRADRLPITKVVEDLVGWVGLGLTAMAGGVGETRFVRPWLEGKRPRREASLRAAWRAAYVITALCGSEAAKAWFVGQQRDFDFSSPVRELAKNTADARSAVVRSAVRFATA
jgi:hypothetical protein